MTFPVTLKSASAPMLSRSHLHSSVARLSAHIRQGRIGFIPPSRGIPLPPYRLLIAAPAISFGSSFAFSIADLMDACVAFSQTSGHCSAHPCFGVNTPYSRNELPLICPSASTTTVLVPRVPMSVPTRYVNSVTSAFDTCFRRRRRWCSQCQVGARSQQALGSGLRRRNLGGCKAIH